MEDIDSLHCEETTIGYSILTIIGCGVGYFTIGYLCTRKIYQTYIRNKNELGTELGTESEEPTDQQI